MEDNKPAGPPKPDPGVVEAQKQKETTMLSPIEEALFQSWAKANQIEDVDDPQSFYDYRGFFKVTNGAVHPPGSVEHFPDTFKQHGHPTFSVESIYSKGPHDGGMWLGETYLPEMKPAMSHEPEDTRSETEKDPIRSLIDVMKEVNKSRQIDTKQYDQKHPKAKKEDRDVNLPNEIGKLDPRFFER